ncbi:MAG: TIGR03087 family PEP-CTERM/XrtA system glycosyltransferase [Phycisphaeraceae bacterium]|nr:TIGR03087 family PEP-CTERM/XrtA system glycosyltransferase [Phycisphaeraceae bacterium]
MSTLRLHPGFHDAPARRVLMLTHRVPYPPDRGDRIRSWNLLRQLAENFELSLACTSDETSLAPGSEQALRRHVRQLAIQRIDPLTMRLRGAAALACGAALTPTILYRRELAKTIRQWHTEQPFDAVLTFCTGMIGYARLLTHFRYRKPGSKPVRHVLDLVDVDSVKWRRFAQSTRSPLRWVYAAEARRLRHIEAGEHDWFDAVTVVSEAEAETYRRHVGDHSRLYVVSNGVDGSYFFPLPESSKPKVAFVGVLDYKPNIDGICWFTNEVWPLVLEQIPGAQLLIVGKRPTAAVRDLGLRVSVKVYPDVPDVRKYLAKAAAVIAPLQIAPGIQNKVLEAMASRRAVIATPGSAAGINATPGEHLLIAEGPRHYAGLVCRALNDVSFRQRIAKAARQLIERRYAWDRVLEPMIGLLAGRVEVQARPLSPIDDQITPPAIAA